MSTDPPIHPYEQLTTPAGELVNIDTEMVPVIGQLWRLGYTTVASCQDVGEATAALRNLAGHPPTPSTDAFIAFHQGYALLKMPRHHAQLLATRLLHTPFRDRISQRWRPESWRMHVPLIHQDTAIHLSATALIHLPRHQLDELTQTLNDLSRIAGGRRSRRPVRPLSE